VTDYPCDKSGDFSFSRFGFIVRTESHTQTEADDRYTHATTIAKSSKSCVGLRLPNLSNLFILIIFAIVSDTCDPTRPDEYLLTSDP